MSYRHYNTLLHLFLISNVVGGKEVVSWVIHCDISVFKTYNKLTLSVELLREQLVKRVSELSSTMPSTKQNERSKPPTPAAVIQTTV